MAKSIRAVETVQIHSLQHIDTGEFVCFFKDGVDYLACFSELGTAREVRSVLGLDDHVDVYTSKLTDCTLTHLWLDFECVEVRPPASA